MRAFLLLFIIGAIFGTVGDFFHVASHTLDYAPDAIRIPLLGNALWAPLLFGVSMLLIAYGHRWGDRVMKHPRPVRAVTPAHVIQGFFIFMALYALSGFIPPSWGLGKDLILLAAGIAVWWYFDRTVVGAAQAAITACLGPVVEIALSHAGAFTYSPPNVYLYGVPGWLPWLYVAVSVTGGNLGRLFLESPRPENRS